MLKSNKNFISTFIAILFELGKNAFFKIALVTQINFTLSAILLEDSENLF